MIHRNRLLATLGLAALTLGLAFWSAAAADSKPKPPRTAEQIYGELKKTYPHNKIHDPEVERKGLIVHPDFEVNLFASAPWVVNPIAMAWDNRNRLWVINAPTYPQIFPGQAYTDFISVLEDTDDDGKADKCTVFDDKLYVPTGIELGDGGVYVANQPDLLFLKDTDGDLKADVRKVLLSGFGTEDNHHAISAFRWGPSGWLHFMSGIFLHTQVETPHGLLRLDDGGTFQFRPRNLKLEMYNIGTATNPWGFATDQWGQNFLLEGPQGGIWWLEPGTVSSKPRERVPETYAPKACCNDFIYSSHFDDKYQGMMVLNAFKNKTVNLYQFSDDGAGYATKEIQPLMIVSKEPYFRPVDVRVGPDGAMYIADFFQEVIGHMQYEFRDPRRDHLNGRIWRVTQKGKKPLSKPNIVAASIPQLCDNLKSPESYIREKSRRELYERSAKSSQAVTSALADFVTKLDPKDARFEHHRLEALWAYATIDVVEPKLLTDVLHSKEPRARAAAVALLRDWLPHIPNAVNLLAERVTDEYPRVRLEAICALSYIKSPQAMELVARAVDLPMDRFLNYSFKHTAVALKDQWLPALQSGNIDFDGSPNRLQASLGALQSGDAITMLLQMVRSGQVPPDRRERVLGLVASLGNPRELAELFDPDRFMALLGKGKGVSPYDPALHAQVLQALARTAVERNVRPDGDLSRLKAMLASDNLLLRTAALRLAGAWKQAHLQADVMKFATDATASAPIRQSAIDALAELGGKDNSDVLKRLCMEEKQPALRQSAIAALAKLDVQAAAPFAAEQLLTESGTHDSSSIFGTILSRKGGGEALVASLNGKKLHADSAKLALRYLNANGLKHEGLVKLLNTTLGTNPLSKQLAAEDLQKLIAEVKEKGDPHRGEQVFRRKDLACLSCHAIAGGGNTIGPDLEGLGTSSPMDYIVESLLLPNKAVREGFTGVKVATDDGRIFHGIQVSKNDKELVLKDAALRQIVRIPAKNIEEMADAASIMPEGLSDSLTRGEFLDLCRFVSDLGRPGEFATPNIPVIRTWRVLPSANGKAQPVDHAQTSSAYSLVSGELPVQEMGQGPVAHVQALIDVGTPGKIKLKINSLVGLSFIVDGVSVALSEETIITVGQGIRTLTFAVDLKQRNGVGLRVVLDEVAGSAARAQVVKGP